MELVPDITPVELYIKFAHALKRVGLDRTLLEFLLCNTPVYTLCKPELLREVSINPRAKGGFESWQTLLPNARDIRVLRIEAPYYASAIAFQAWATLLNSFDAHCN
jgi:hypothetical protein